MNCYMHTETPAVAFCRACGRPLCGECRREAQGTVFCTEHLPAPVEMPPRYAAVPPGPGRECSSALALLLGFIPGVGAIYNGQYAKGLVHAIIFGLLVSIQSSGGAEGLEPLFGVLTASWVFYMALEAYHTCKKRQAGEPVDEFSSILNLRDRSGNFPAGALLLIALGVILLLNTMGYLEFRYIVRYWPLILILMGVYMLFNRLSGSGDSVTRRGVGDERR